MTATAQLTVVPEETAVLGWLKLLGWTVVIDRDGSQWLGFAWRTDSLGAELCVGESATSQREVVSKLLSSARGLALQAA
jgi:hypothetical protein